MSTIKILGIESSCDDTSASVVTSEREILSNIIVSQNAEHKIYNGVVPEIASRAHLEKLDHCVKQALLIANTSLDQITGIAVTVGPGLIGGLMVGMMYAKGLAHVTKHKIVYINHLEGHILSSRLFSKELEYPYLTLLVSGGHTQFVHVQSLGKYSILGKTLDDSAGECIDKVAKMLGLGYPGGPAVEKAASLGDPNKYELPMPMLKDNNLSFSGLKTAARLLIERLSLSMPKESFTNDVCASLQHTVSHLLSRKTSVMLEQTKARQFALVGGVAANSYIRSKIKSVTDRLGVDFIVPSKELCTDNAAMIAWAGTERLISNITSSYTLGSKIAL